MIDKKVKQGSNIEELFMSIRGKINPDLIDAPLKDHENYLTILIKATAAFAQENHICEAAPDLIQLIIFMSSNSEMLRDSLSNYMLSDLL